MQGDLFLMRLRDRLELALGRRLVRAPAPLLRLVGRGRRPKGLDPEVDALLGFLDRVRPRKLHQMQPSRARREMARLPYIADLRAPEIGAVHDATIPRPVAEGGPVPVRIYAPIGERARPVLVYFHGGGGVVGSVDTHDVPCRLLCDLAGCVVASVGYRLAPEHPFPAGFEDALAAYRWAAATPDVLGGDGRVAVGGDSMGGCLAAAVAQATRADANAPVAQLLIYPVVDMQAQTDSRAQFGTGLFLTTAMIEWFHGHYVGSADPTDVRASPGRASSLRGLAPAFVGTAGLDPLRDEGNAYAEALAEAGVAVEHRCFDDQVHGFIHMTGISKRSLAAVHEVAHALRRLVV